jgi:hypothetical protein
MLKLSDTKPLIFFILFFVPLLLNIYFPQVIEVFFLCLAGIVVAFHMWLFMVVMANDSGSHSHKLSNEE